MKVKIDRFKLEGSMQIVPSKSILHRVLIIASLAKGCCRIDNVSYSDDEDYINVTSLFKRNTPTNVIEDELSPSVEVDQEEIKRRCQALSGVDKISSSLSPFEKEGS